MLALVWDDVDFDAGAIHVRAQLSRAHRGAPARRVPPKTVASAHDIPLVAQLARLLAAHKQASRFARGDGWEFATARGTPNGHRNVSRRSDAPRSWQGSTTTAGRRFASTICGTRSRAI